MHGSLRVPTAVNSVAGATTAATTPITIPEQNGRHSVRGRVSAGSRIVRRAARKAAQDGGRAAMSRRAADMTAIRHPTRHAAALEQAATQTIGKGTQATRVTTADGG